MPQPFLRSILHLPALFASMVLAGCAQVPISTSHPAVAAANVPVTTHAQESVADDGPYIFRVGEQLDASWICDGKPIHRTLRASRLPVAVTPACGYPHTLFIAPPNVPAAGKINSGSRVVALSDIHGQYDILVRLLRAHHIIDARDRWTAGRTTLVIAGDVFDRGPQVMEAFWLLYSLQQYAADAGGSVQFLLGNHEAIVLYDDLRYVNPKYQDTAKLLGRSYPSLYGPDSVIGQWLRSRPALLLVGDTLFLHGGIAPENLDLVAHIAKTNEAYRASLGKPRAEVKLDPALSRLYDGKTSPIWYRGYFNGQLDTAQVETLITQLGARRIVVGHTTMGEVASFHGGRVIAIDSGIKRGKSGQLLFIENGKLSRGLMDGTREPLPELQEVPEDKE